MLTNAATSKPHMDTATRPINMRPSFRITSDKSSRCTQSVMRFSHFQEKASSFRAPSINASKTYKGKQAENPHTHIFPHHLDGLFFSRISVAMERITNIEQSIQKKNKMSTAANRFELNFRGRGETARILMMVRVSSFSNNSAADYY